MAEPVNLTLHNVSANTPVKVLEISAAFDALSENEALYAYHFARAAWRGARACLDQVSAESKDIFDLLLSLFRSQADGQNHKSGIDQLEKRAKEKVSESEWSSFLAYAAVFFSNMGNYLSFGDTKLTPSLSEESFGNIVAAAADAAPDKESLLASWEKLKEGIFSLTEANMQLGFPPNGKSSLYSPDVTKEEADAVTKFLGSQKVEPWNTRLWKLGPSKFELRIAAAEKREVQTLEATDSPIGPFSVQLFYGDYQEEMAGVVEELEQALKYAAGSTQEEMVKAYIRHFKTGDVSEHKQSQRLWVQDKGPVVETNIGFIETYSDPLGMRAQFEGLVAIVNKSMSAKFAQLVDAAPELLTHMPWPRAYEKDTFLRPDFTSLEVLAFASTGVPAGINIPNYDEIRQNEGFKNVSLGNVLSAREGSEPISFIAAHEQELYRKLKGPAFEVQVGCHELLGHGSGKLLMESEDGKLNFESSLVNPITGNAVQSWYKAGQTWDSVFGSVSSTMEECRAECTGIFMSALPQVMEIFGHSGKEAEDVVYINWLLMARAGLMALEFYTPNTKTWRQAHMQARYVILRTLLAASEADPSDGEPLLKIVDTEEEKDAQKVAGLEVHLNQAKIRSVGVPAVSQLLHRLNIYKATADLEGGKAMYDSLSAVDDEWLLKRNTVLANKQPRPIYVQAHTELDPATNKVTVIEFDASHAGVVESFLVRYA